MDEIKKGIYKGNALKKVRSKYILKQILDNVKQIKLLQIIRYNNHLKKKLGITNKNYFLEYSKIEIEIIPMIILYGTYNFININEKNKSYYHIYFNDNLNEEIKKYSIDKNDNVFKIKIIIDYEIKSLSKLFYDCDCLKNINFIKFNREDIQGMNNMFKGCTLLKEINFSQFNSKNVTNMSYMFYDCSSLIKLDLSKFNTNKVKIMSNMFYNCSSLKELNISSFDMFIIR